MTDLPYQAEYAKSGRAACKGCKQKIDQGALRLAIMVQSAFFDGKQPNWHHEECFFKKQHPASVSEIGNFYVLKNNDQARIKNIMKNSTGIVMPTEKPKGKGKSKKRSADDSNAESTELALKDYKVEYAKSSRATCKHCEIKICKDEVRIAKTVYDTEVGRKYGGEALWHHVKCFAERRSEFLFFAGGESLPGFKSLKKEDQAIVKGELKPFKKDDVPVKKLKEEPKSEQDLKEEKDKEKKLEKQNKLFHKYRKALSELTKQDLEELLEVNSQELPVGRDGCLDRLADCMTFGALKPCEECKHGQLVLDTYGYKCTESTDEASPISGYYLKLKAEIAILPTESPEFEMIQEYVRNTHAATHSGYSLEVEQVFKVVREGEDKRYKPFKKLHNKRLLWHGSRVTNFAGIISQGLRIAPPEAPVTGYMFGKGVYFADMVSKSANYCCTNVLAPVGFMLLCEVALGNMKECHHAENVKLPPNMHSAWGVGRTQPDPTQNRVLDDGTIVPLGKPVNSKVNTSLLYNEFIVYDVAQVNVKYLLQMKFKFNMKY